MSGWTSITEAVRRARESERGRRSLGAVVAVLVVEALRRMAVRRRGTAPVRLTGAITPDTSLPPKP